jgi:hypothetical protein
MACITLFAQPFAMATTHLVPAVEYAKTPACPSNGTAERKTVSLSWVVVTDDNGARQLRMRWALDR